MSDLQSVILLDNIVKSCKDQVSLEQICAFNNTLKVFLIEQMDNSSLGNAPNFSALRYFNLYFSMRKRPVTHFLQTSVLK